MNKYYEKALEMKDEIIQSRRKLHNFAEIGFELPKTLNLVENKLKDYGLNPKRSGKAGITCTVGKPGKAILLRADMDALPMKEKTNLHFAAENGNCHSCGHDCHTAMLLGAAKLLKENEKNLNGTVKFMFQPAEELLAGAEDMIEAGILESPKVDAAIGMHIAVGTEQSKSGLIYYTKGTALFSGDAIRIEVKGKTAHGSTPEKGVDAINISAHIVISLQEIISQEISCQDQSVVIVGKIQGGDTVNTLPGNAVIEVSVRAATEENRAYLKRRVKEISENVANTFRGEAVVEFLYGIGPLYNDPVLSEEISKYCKEILGNENVSEVPPSAGTEDFTAVSKAVPSIMLNLGAGSTGEGYSCSLHNPAMTIDENILYKGSALYAHCADSYLKNR